MTNEIKTTKVDEATKPAIVAPANPAPIGEPKPEQKTAPVQTGPAGQ